MSCLTFLSQKHTPVNFQHQRLFETEVIKEKVVFKMSVKAHQFAIIESMINPEMLGGLYFQGFHISMIPTTGKSFKKNL